MQCSDCVEWIAQKLDGYLSDDKVRQLEEHLSRCSRCRAELFFQKKIQEALTEEVYAELSTDFTEHVFEKVLESAQIERRTHTWASLIPAFTLVAATIVLFFMGDDLLRVFPSATEPLTSAVSKSLTWMGDLLLGILADAADLGREHISAVGGLPQPLLNSLIATLLASVSVIWGLSRIFAFLRE